MLSTSSTPACEVHSSCSLTPNAVRGAALPASCSCAQHKHRLYSDFWAADAHCLPAAHGKLRPPCHGLLRRGVWVCSLAEGWMQGAINLSASHGRKNAAATHLEADVDVADAELEAP